MTVDRSAAGAADERGWYKRPMRIAALQCNFEADPLSIPDTWREMGFNVEQLFHPMAEGYTALYDAAKHKKHLAAYIARARERGMRIILYLNVHILPASAAARRDEWAQRNARGEYETMYGTYLACCVNSAWRNHFFGVLAALHDVDIDGVFLDGPYFGAGGCHCPACRQRYRDQVGRDMADGADLSDFCRGSLDAFLRESYRRFKAIKPDGIFYQNLGLLHLSSSRMRLPDALDYNDFLGTEGGFMFYGPPQKAYLFKPGLAAKVSEAVAPAKPRVIFMAADQKPWSWLMHAPAETALCIASSAANGSSVWYGLHGSTRLLDTPGGRAAADLFRFMEKHEDVYRPAPSIARVAVFFSFQTEASYRSTGEETDLYGKRADQPAGRQGNFMEAIQGTVDWLTRSGVPFDIVTDLDLSAETRQRYDCIILPTAACMSEAAVAAIAAYVEAGGNIISCFDTSLYDEAGKRRASFGLGKVFGIDGRGETVEFKNFNYFKTAGDAPHPLFKGLEDIPLFPAPATGMVVTPRPDCRVLAHFLQPLAGRYVALGPTGHPAVLLNGFGKGQSLYFAGTFAEQFSAYNHPEYRRLFQNAVALLATSPVELRGGHTNVEVVVRRQSAAGQAGKGRLVIHLVNHAGVFPRPFERIMPQRGLTLNVRDGHATGARADSLAAGAPCAVQRTAEGLSIALPELGAYDVITLE